MYMCTHTGQVCGIIINCTCHVLPYMYINYMFYVSLLYSYSPLLFLVVTVDRYLQGTNIFNLLVPCSNT